MTRLLTLLFPDGFNLVSVLSIAGCSLLDCVYYTVLSLNEYSQLCVDRLNNALETTVALELAPSAFPVFEDYAKSTSGNGQKLLKSIAGKKALSLLHKAANDWRELYILL